MNRSLVDGDFIGDNFLVKASWPGRDDFIDEDLKILWRVMVEDGVPGAVFYDCEMNELSFFELVRQPHNYFAAIYDLLVADKPLAFFWLNNHTGALAMIHFGFLKNGLALKDSIGPAVLNWCFGGGLECLISLTPAYNLAAKHYGESLGGRVMGILEGACFSSRFKRPVNGRLIKFSRIYGSGQ